MCESIQVHLSTFVQAGVRPGVCVLACRSVSNYLCRILPFRSLVVLLFAYSLPYMRARKIACTHKHTAS